MKFTNIHKLSNFRYQGMEESIERYVMEIVHEQINRKQGTDNITRNFLRFLSSSCGLVEVIASLLLDPVAKSVFTIQ